MADHSNSQIAPPNQPQERFAKRILNVGAGVGSTTVWLLALDGKIPPFDAGAFADTQGEPKAVYDHLEWMKAQGGPPIYTATRGDLAKNLTSGVNAAGQGRKGGSGRFVSIPAYTSAPLNSDANEGQTRRQCSKEYKVDVVERIIRQQLFNLKPRQRMPKGVRVEQAFGLHDDEARRIKRVRERMRKHPWSVPSFPLALIGWTRADCLRYLEKRAPHPVPRSACVFCPYRSDTEWKHLRDTDPEGWARAVQIDEAIRDPASARARGMNESLYLHRSCIPLPLVDIDAGAAKEEARRVQGKRQLDLFGEEDCQGLGVCGL